MSSCFDLCYWMGCFGYPLDPQHNQNIEQLTDANDAEALAKCDTFCMQRSMAAMLHTFHSSDKALYSLAPLYPLAPRVQAAAAEAEEEEVLASPRGPTSWHLPWPSRILWRPASGVRVVQRYLEANHDMLSSSRHCPLSSSFEMSVDVHPLRAPPMVSTIYCSL